MKTKALLNNCRMMSLLKELRREVGERELLRKDLYKDLEKDQERSQ